MTGVARAEIAEPLRCGRRGRRHLDTGFSELFVVTTLVPGRTYAETLRLPGARVERRREIRTVVDGAEITVMTTVRGRLAWFYRRRLTTRLEQSLPAELERLCALLESEQGTVAETASQAAPEEAADAPTTPALVPEQPAGLSGPVAAAAAGVAELVGDGLQLAPPAVPSSGA